MFVNTVPVCSSAAITAGSSQTYQYSTASYGISGFYSLQLTVAGSGTAQVDILCSNDGTTFLTPDGATSVMLGKTAGTYLAPFQIPACGYFQIKISEVSAANSITVTAVMAAI